MKDCPLSFISTEELEIHIGRHLIFILEKDDEAEDMKPKKKSNILVVKFHIFGGRVHIFWRSFKDTHSMSSH